MRSLSQAKAKASIPADQYFRELEAWAKQKRFAETARKAAPRNNVINLAEAKRRRS